MIRFLFVIALASAAIVGCGRTTSVATFGAPSAPPATTVPAWYVDPGLTVDGGAGSCSSDTNSCQSATCGAAGSGIGPCVTVGSIVQRWGTNSPVLAQSTTINLLSDDTSEMIDLSPRFSAGITSAYFALNGTLIQTGTATIGTFTAQNRTTNQTNTITAQGQSGSFWTPFVNQLVHDTTANAWFWVESDLGTATARITTPLATSFRQAIGFPAPAYVTIANGDSLVITRPSKVQIANMSPAVGRTYWTFLQHLWMTAGSGAPGLSVPTTITESYVDPQVVISQCPSSVSTFFANSVLNATTGTIETSIIGGAVESHSMVMGVCPGASSMSWDGDVLIDTANTRGIHVGPGLFIGFAWLNANIDLDGCFGGTIGIGSHDTGNGSYSGAALWGPAGLDLEDSCALRCQTFAGGTCVSKLLLAGQLTINSQSTATPWQASTRTWLAPATITPALIDDAGAVCNVATGDCWRQ